jgi:UDP-GlcNAc:undecaprenyl-phosphate GlcNAc-1-phosphate transferase
MLQLIHQPVYAYSLTFVVALALSLLLTPLCRLLAMRMNILDHPHSAIKTHRTPTPYLGGLAIWGAWAASLFFIRLLTHFPTGTLRSLRGILLGSLCILLLGFIDDAIPKGLGFKKKFLFQIIAAALILSFDIRMHFIHPGFMAVLISIIWVIGITNAFNIIDIMDGLSSGIAVIASLAFLFIALPTEQIYVNVCAIALAGGCLGFLPFNLSKKRKIFMGDAGSLTIGFILASVSMGTSYTSLNNLGIFAPLLILAVPIYDTILVMILRWRKGQSPFLGSKDHFALRLEIMGFSRTQILMITYTVAALLAFSAFQVTRLPANWAAGVYGFCFILAIAISRQLSKVKID